MPASAPPDSLLDGGWHRETGTRRSSAQISRPLRRYLRSPIEVVGPRMRPLHLTADAVCQSRFEHFAQQLADGRIRKDLALRAGEHQVVLVPHSRATTSTSSALSLNGTRCLRPAFMRSADTVQRLAERETIGFLPETRAAAPCPRFPSVWLCRLLCRKPMLDASANAPIRTLAESRSVPPSERARPPQRSRIRAGKLPRNLAYLSDAAISLRPQRGRRMRGRFQHQPQAHRHYAAKQPMPCAKYTRRPSDSDSRENHGTVRRGRLPDSRRKNATATPKTALRRSPNLSNHDPDNTSATTLRPYPRQFRQ